MWKSALLGLGAALLILGSNSPCVAAVVGPPSAQTAQMHQANSLLAWWLRPELLARLGLEQAEGLQLAQYLRNAELSYQVAHTELRQLRREQSKMLEDASVDQTRILQFHRQRLQATSGRLLDLNIMARLWVREQMTAEQLRAVLTEYPGFFRARWFRAGRNAVKQGSVRPDQP